MIGKLGLQWIGIPPRSVLAALCAWPLLSAVHGAALTTNEAYLFTSFHEPARDGLRFLYSFDGYHWSNVPGVFLKPNAGQGKLMRDPSLVRGPDGTFHLVWTTAWRGDPGFGHASTKDLVHWSEQQFIPVMTNEPSTVNVWAPEIFYDANENQFVIAWASTIPGRFPVLTEATNNNHRMYFTTTSDFKTFAPTKLFYDPGFSVIDGFVAKDDGRYLLVHKDNSRSNLCLRVAFGERPTGAWGGASEAFTEKFTEGPSALKVGDEWLIYFDMYRSNRYGAVLTRDFKTFTNVTEEVSFPAGHKHGTALVVERKVLDYILRVGGEQADYTRAIEGRTKDILDLLGLTDNAKVARVHDVIMAQYRALRAWHDSNDEAVKALTKEAGQEDNAETASKAQARLREIQGSLKKIHDDFLASLSADLDARQLEAVKDKMTYNKVKVTYEAYVDIVPGLRDAQKARILDFLKQAREEAMDCGSAEEKSAVFNRYKGKINNYLSANGHDVGKAYKDRREKQKTTNSVQVPGQ